MITKVVDRQVPKGSWYVCHYDCYRKLQISNMPLEFIHSCYFYSTSSSPLLLRGAPDTAQILCRGFTPQATASEGLAQGPYLAARAGLERMTLRTKGDESTNEPPRP